MCSRLVTLILFAKFLNHANSQYIIDTKNPIVIQYGRMGEGKENNLFGYSLAFMKGNFGKTFLNHPAETPHGRLFIGAPKEIGAATKNSGVVWSCQFNKNGSSVNCSIVSTVSEQKLPISCTKNNSVYFPESETNQWIGANLATTKYNLYACAPRWKVNGFKIYSSGECETETSISGACYMVTSPTENVNVLGPFYEKDKYTGSWRRYTQFGFSSHSTRSNNMLFGVPSSNIPIKFQKRWECKGTYMEYLPGLGAGMMFLRDRDPQCYTYLGYSITSGRMKGEGEYVAISAPRGPRETLVGYVLLNKFQSSNEKIQVIGEQFGSYFGYSMATLDLDGDGDDELIVGAPQFTLDFNREKNFNGGCVFIYDIDLNLRSQKKLNRMCLEEEPKGARFGSAIANLGDINFDKMEDFAVSAPYHEDGVGTVFIYYEGFRLSKIPDEIIRGKSLNVPNLRGFGTNLLAGDNLDVDGSATPDLAISSFESNHVVILRTHFVTKPVVTVTYHSEASLFDSEKIDKYLPSSNENRVRVRTCISFNFSVDIQQRDLMLASVIKFEMDPGASFDDGNGFKMQFFVDATNITCLNRYIKISSGLKGGQNKITVVRFRAGLSYNHLESQGATATLNVAQQQNSDLSFSQAFSSFNKHLPATIPATFSGWEDLVIANDNCESDGIPDCDPTLKLEVKMNFEDGKGQLLANNDTILVGQAETIILNMWLSNSHETAYRPTLRVSLGFTDHFDLPKLEWQWRVKETAKFEKFRGNPSTRNGLLNAEDIVRCSKPLQNESKILSELRISNLRQMKVRDHLQGKIFLRVEAFPENQRESEKVDKRMEILLKAELKIDLLAMQPKPGQTEIDPKHKLVDLTQIYILNNTGFSSSGVDKIKLEIVVPTHMLVKDKWTKVLGIVNPSQFSFEMRCESKNFSFYKSGTPTSSEVEPEYLLAKGRNTSDIPLPFVPIFENFLNLAGCKTDNDHQQHSQYCRKIICYTDLPSLESRTVQIQMYLLGTAASNLIFRDTVGIRVISSISVHYLNVTVKSEGETWRKFSIPKEIPFWMMGAAAGGGIMVLFLVTLILYKCGFFQRKAREQLKDLKRQSLRCLDLNVTLPVTEPANRDDDQNYESTTSFGN